MAVADEFFIDGYVLDNNDVSLSCYRGKLDVVVALHKYDLLRMLKQEIQQLQNVTPLLV